MAATKPEDPMNPDNLLETLRGLIDECHAEQDGTRKAVKAMAVVHLAHIIDVMISAGHPFPRAWALPLYQAHDTNAG